MGGSDNPVPLRPAEVSRILGTVDELQEQQDDLDIQFYVGENVKITFGPFNGFTGVIEEVNAEKKKLKVMVKFSDVKHRLSWVICKWRRNKCFCYEKYCLSLKVIDVIYLKNFRNNG